jgi:deoxyribodipyrimidine photo-lyase
MKKPCIYIFTRDLRIYDNKTLEYASSISSYIIPIFIFNPVQITSSNKYKSNNCIQFMCECLDDLNDQLKKIGSRLFLFYGDPLKIIEKMLDEYDEIEGVYFNKDYTPFAIQREKSIKNMCSNYDKKCESFDDYLITNNPNFIKNKSGNSYVKFTPFYNEALKHKVAEVSTTKIKNFLSKTIKLKNEFIDDYHSFYKINKNINIDGGRSNALVILKQIKNFSDYNDERDYPSKNTTLLSAYLKFNVVSIREVYHTIKTKLPKNTKLITQLYWRDFYMIIMYNHPYVLEKSMNAPKIKWIYNETYFKKWMNGNTGFPIVDAGMRQLNKTGWMHNRARMIVACFLVKIIGINWKKGEQYFAQTLVDYDPYNNNGGWQWVAGTGTDSQPYFRYLNPWSQSIKFDKDCEYIKEWVPELKNVISADIHKWNIKYVNYDKIKYPKPMFDDILARIKNNIK